MQIGLLRDAGRDMIALGMVEMRSTQTRLVAIDMDGTLLGTDGRVSARNVAAIHAAEVAGIEVVVATGRRHCYAMHILRGLELDEASALVSSNGTVIRTIGAELLHRTYMPNETARRLCEHMTEFRSTLVLTFDNVGSDGEDGRGAITVEDLAALEATIDRWVKVNEPYIAEVRPLEASLEGEPPIQMMLCGTVARMREAEARLMEYPRVTAVGQEPAADALVTLHRTEYPERDLCILDVLPAGCSKATALEQLAALRGISMAEVVAIGDNWNDVPMLAAAGAAVVMANAPEDVKALAAERGWTVGLSNDEDGVAVALEGMVAATERAAMVV
jgi:HAD superfamily hydrolase (TIGR01484 family)